MKTKFARLAAALAFALPLGAAAYAADSASSGGIPEYPLMQPRHVQWSFTGPFGKYDPQQLQRGFQIYKEVCSNCHSLSMVAFRTLASTTGPHFTDDEAKAIAAGYSIADPTVESGERPGRPSDVFPPAPPFPGAQSARPLADRQGACGRARVPDLHLRFLHAVRAGGRAGLHLLAPDRLPGRARGLQGTGRELLQSLFHLRADARHAPAAHRRAGELRAEQGRQSERTTCRKPSTSTRRTWRLSSCGRPSRISWSARLRA